VPVRQLLTYRFGMFGFQFGFLFLGMKLGMPAGLASLVLQFQVFVTMAGASVVFEGPSLIASSLSHVGATALLSVAYIVYLSMLVAYSLELAAGAPPRDDGHTVRLARADFWHVEFLAGAP